MGQARVMGLPLGAFKGQRYGLATSGPLTYRAARCSLPHRKSIWLGATSTVTETGCATGAGGAAGPGTLATPSAAARPSTRTWYVFIVVYLQGRASAVTPVRSIRGITNAVHHSPGCRFLARGRSEFVSKRFILALCCLLPSASARAVAEEGPVQPGL